MDPTPGAAAGRHDDRHPLQPGPRVCEFPDAPGRRRRLSTNQHPPSTGNGDVYDHSIDIQTAEFGIPIPNSQFLPPISTSKRGVTESSTASWHNSGHAYFLHQAAGKESSSSSHQVVNSSEQIHLSGNKRTPLKIFILQRPPPTAHDAQYALDAWMLADGF